MEVLEGGLSGSGGGCSGAFAGTDIEGASSAISQLH